MHTFPKLQHSIVRGCSIVTIIIYLIIAILLVATVIVGTVDSVSLLIKAVENPTQIALTAALQSILFLIIVASLIDMVRSYVRVGRVLLRPILIAGITTMVRRLLVTTDIAFIDIIGIIIAILGLTVAMIYLGREDRRISEFLAKNGDVESRREEEE